MQQAGTKHEHLFEEYNKLEALKLALQKLAISNKNAQASPFLRLPAETRNNIYAYVFETQVLEVRVKGDISLCNHVIEIRGPPSRPEGKETVESLQNESKESSMADSATAARANGAAGPICPNRVQQMLTTTQVCRQMYLDTALLSFRNITFSSEYLEWLMAWFERRLYPGQRNAIASIKIRFELVVFQSWSTLDQLSLHAPVMKMLASFPHLTRLVLTDWNTWRNWNRDNYSLEMVQDEITKATGLSRLLVVGSDDRMFCGGGDYVK